MIGAISFKWRFLIIVLLFAEVCLGQTVSKPVEKVWWFNPFGAPLKIQLPKHKRNLFVVNISEKEVAKYRLGCVLVKEDAVSNVLSKWSFKKAERLLSAVSSKFYFEGLEDAFNDENICPSGKLSVITVLFKDGSKYSVEDPSSDPADTTLSDQETLDVIRCLLKNKGDKRKANTLTASRSQNNSRLFDAPTREVASLFYISSLFYGNEGFAMAIALEREGDDKLNSKTTVRLAYEAYQKWFEKVKKIGLKEAREQKLDPLAGSGVSWY